MNPLGPRASFLLGQLRSRPCTVSELRHSANLAVRAGGAVPLRSLLDGGQEEIRRLLGRLEEFGFASHVEVDGEELWTATTSARSRS